MYVARGSRVVTNVATVADFETAEVSVAAEAEASEIDDCDTEVIMLKEGKVTTAISIYTKEGMALVPYT